MLQTVAPRTVSLEPHSPPPAVNLLPWQVSWCILSHAQSGQSSYSWQRNPFRRAPAAMMSARDPGRCHTPCAPCERPLALHAALRCRTSGGQSQGVAESGCCTAGAGFFVVFHFFGLAPGAGLAALERAGRRHCAQEWEPLRAVRGAELQMDQYCFRRALPPHG